MRLPTAAPPPRPAESPSAAPAPVAAPGTPWTRVWAPALLAAILGTRFLVLLRSGLFNDEAYYWEWSRHLAWGYFDHPPAVAWAIAASTRLLGQTAAAVHLPAFAGALASTAALFALARDLFPERPSVAWWAVLACNCAPLFGMGATFSTPDALATPCWIAATWLVWRGTHGEPRAWYLAGVACGLGLLSKYTMALFPVVAGAWLLGPSRRAWFRRREPWLAVAIAALLFAPVVAWNARHGWASFWFQGVDRHLGPWQPLATLRRFVVAQQAMSPLLWLACLAALVRSVRLARAGSDAHALLACTGGGVLAFFAAFALHTWVNPNWTAVAYPALLVAAGDLVAGRSWPWRVLPPATAAVLTAIFTAQALWLPLPIGRGNDFPANLHGWPEVGAHLRALRDGMPDPARTFAYAHRFQDAALVAFYADGVEVTRLGGNRPDAYDAWRDPESFRGRDAILFGDEATGPDPSFRRCEPAGSLPVFHGARHLRTIAFWRCWSFQP